VHMCTRTLACVCLLAEAAAQPPRAPPPPKPPPPNRHPPPKPQVLDEIGVDLSASLAGTSAPTKRVAAPAAAVAEGAKEPSLDDDVLARLAQLKS
jgi:hypothetical protein